MDELTYILQEKLSLILYFQSDACGLTATRELPDMCPLATCLYGHYSRVEEITKRISAMTMAVQL